ncbi:hypothetical protein F8M41_004939 [Gigaspora margarita]|uniref:Uncharacterized protein n=1 Tax=Gigaspora margarita TaxID=4874 RepID=A0A8H3X8X4_GIGMA|nr:hypothetical protein F8M41_004939 [Gigaspora margarita]
MTDHSIFLCLARAIGVALRRAVLRKRNSAQKFLPNSYWKYIISDIFPDFKYPSDETIKSAKDKICKHRGTIVKKIKDTLFEVFHDKLNKIDSSDSADTIKLLKNLKIRNGVYAN